MKEMIGDYGSFVETVTMGLERAGIDRSELALLDHLCYRVETEARYYELFRQFSKLGDMIGEEIVGGRPIATFEFTEPLEASGWRIPYLELPAPKDGSPYTEGLEHCEFVVVGSLEKFAQRHEGQPFDRKGMDKMINPELGLKTEYMSVKFHELQLGAVIGIEQRLGGDEEGAMNHFEHDLPKEIGISATRALLDAGITNLNQAQRMSEKELLALHGVGPKAVRILKKNTLI